MPENPKPRRLTPGALAVVGLGLLLAAVGTHLPWGTGRRSDAGRPDPHRPETPAATRATRDRLRWTAEVREGLAASTPFGAEESEATTPADDLRRLLANLARQDPAAALAAVAAATDDATARHKMAVIIVRTWAADHPQEAWAWACAVGDSWSCPDQPPLRCAALQGMAATAPEFLVRTVTAQATSIGESDLITTATAALLNAGQVQRAEHALLGWCCTLPAGSVESVAVQAVVNELSRRSPAEARAWLEALPASINRDAAETALAGRWAETAPHDAVVWASGLDSAPARGSALEVAFYAWSDRDPEAAIQWLAQNPAGPTNDRLIGNLVSQRAFRAANPRQAVQLAEAIHDPSAREQALRAALLTWSGFDRATALRYAQAAAGLSDSQRAEIVGLLQQHSDFPAY